MPGTRAPQPGRQAADTREARTDLAAALRRIAQDVARGTHRLLPEHNPKYAGAHFAALKRLLDREYPDYAQ